jgi:predicted O-methyltransferase YrrM
MSRAYEAKGWQQYVMRWHDPHRQLEPLEREEAVIDGALATLVQAGILPHSRYDGDKMLAHRAAVHKHFDIPWTAISPRMQRLLYAINAIAQPQVMVAVGIFCGNTFISNAGAAVGPGACYRAKRLVGLEICPREADRARRNAATIDPEGQAEIIAADGPRGTGKSIYLDLLQAALHALRPGSLILAHNSVNAAHTMTDYMAYVRDPNRLSASVNMIVDDQGLQVSMR